MRKFCNFGVCGWICASVVLKCSGGHGEVYSEGLVGVWARVHDLADHVGALVCVLCTKFEVVYLWTVGLDLDALCIKMIG